MFCLSFRTELDGYTPKGVTYVSIYVNDGIAAGNIRPILIKSPNISTIPPVIEIEAEAAHKFMNENGNCPACLTLGVESEGLDRYFLLIHILAFCPWASRNTPMNSGFIQEA